MNLLTEENFWKALAICSMLLTVCVLGSLAYFSRYGFDFTDEGFYLNWISNPFNLGVAPTQFGYIYYPLYLLLDGNLQAIRLFNVAITFTLGFLIFNVLFELANPNTSVSKSDRLTLSAGLSLSSLIIFDTWLVTPNYNTLNLQALMLSFLAVLKLTYKSDDHTAYKYWILLGVAAWLVFMAKPTSLALLSIALILYFWISKKLDWKGLLVSSLAAMSLFLIGAYVISGSVHEYIYAIKSSLELSQTLGSKNVSNLWRLHSLKLHPEIKEFLAYSVLVFSALYLFGVSRMRTFKNISLASAFLLLLTAFYVLVSGEHPVPATRFQSVVMASVLFATVIFLLLSILRTENSPELRTFNWPLIFLALAIPYIYTFGTGSYYFHVGARSLMFWVASSVILVLSFSTKLTRNFFYTLLITVQLLAIILLRTGLDNPYRQPHTLINNQYQLTSSNSSLMVPMATGEYVEEVKRAAINAGLVSGTPLLDLTGQSPGLVYMLGAEPLGASWLLGGYPGSNQFVEKAIRSVDCSRLSSAWLITEPQGTRAISSDVLTSFNASIDTDYQVVGEFVVPSEVGGRKQSQKQYLHKPIREHSRAILTCEQARENRS